MIEKIIKKYKKKSFLIAYSGGLDSTVLLFQFLKMKKKIPNIKIRAIHINHNISLLSKKWVEHCKKICSTIQIPLVIENVYINTNISNIEAKLRAKRYNVIYNNLYSDEILVTGHHMNDQCETLILSLKRGSGPTGLASMSFETLFGEKKIIRPFLNKTKKELELWALNNNLKWIEDFSNKNINYDRNFIRHEIIPILEKRWPYFIKNCFRTTKICKIEKELLNNFLHEKISHLLRNDCSLDITHLKNMKKEICISYIRYWIIFNKIKKISYKSIESIYDQMINSRIDANPKIILGSNEIRRYKKSLYFIKTQPILKNTLLFWHKKNEKLVLPNNLGNLIQNNQGNTLPAPKSDQVINIRFQHEGNLLIIGRDKKRKLKKIWQEQKIPPWLRNQIPLLFYNDDFISALGVFVVNLKFKYRKTWKISWQSNLKSVVMKNIFSFY